MIAHLFFRSLSGLFASTPKMKQEKDRAGEPYGNDSYFMTVALLFAKKSPDPNTKVGVCIVNQEGNIVGVGYNKMPNDCEDKGFSWERDPVNKLNNKHSYVCHAEMNAIMNKTSVDVKGCTLYATLFPCNECSKVIIQSGIRGVVYLSNKYAQRVESEASRRLLDAAGIIPRQFLAKQEVKNLLSSVDPDTE